MVEKKLIEKKLVEKKVGRKKIDRKKIDRRKKSIDNFFEHFFFDQKNRSKKISTIFLKLLSFLSTKKNPRVSLASSLNISGYLWIAMENDPNKVKIHSFLMKKHQNSWKFIKKPSKSIIVRLKCTNFPTKNQCTNFLKRIRKMWSVSSSQHHISELWRSWEKNTVSRTMCSRSATT